MNQILDQIPHSRQVVYLIALTFFIPLFIFFSKWSELSSIRELQYTIETLSERSSFITSEQQFNEQVQNYYRGSDRFYIDKELESLSFLSEERNQLLTLSQNPNFSGDPRVTKRLEQLTGKSNQLLFSEGSVESIPYLQEKILSQLSSVQLSLDDVGQILSKIEGTSVGKFPEKRGLPHLIPLDIKLEKIEPTPKNQVYLLSMQLLQREYP